LSREEKHRIQNEIAKNRYNNFNKLNGHKRAVGEIVTGGYPKLKPLLSKKDIEWLYEMELMRKRLTTTY
jgi:hypothetical protein